MRAVDPTILLGRRRLLTAVSMISLVIVLGTIGFMAIEHWPAFDALYMTIITIASVGFGEVHPLSTTGRLFTMLLILFGGGTVIYSLTVVAEIILEEQIAPATFLRRRARQRVRKMRDHLIVCGYGRVGFQVAAELKREGVPVVVIDADQEALDRCAADGYAFIKGDASEDEILREAGIEHARGLIVTTNSDANNVYITLAARALRPDVFIVARMDRDAAASKLRTAGADRIISPYHIGGRRIAAMVLRPAVVDFVDTVLRSRQASLRLEELQIRTASPLAGTTVAELRSRFGVEASVLAIVYPDEALQANPPPDAVLRGDAVLIILGTDAALAILERVAGGRAV